MQLCPGRKLLEIIWLGSEYTPLYDTYTPKNSGFRTAPGTGGERTLIKLNAKAHVSSNSVFAPSFRGCRSTRTREEDKSLELLLQWLPTQRVKRYKKSDDEKQLMLSN